MCRPHGLPVSPPYPFAVRPTRFFAVACLLAVYVAVTALSLAATQRISDVAKVSSSATTTAQAAGPVGQLMGHIAGQLPPSVAGGQQLSEELIIHRCDFCWLCWQRLASPFAGLDCVPVRVRDCACDQMGGNMGCFGVARAQTAQLHRTFDSPGLWLHFCGSTRGLTPPAALLFPHILHVQSSP